MSFPTLIFTTQYDDFLKLLKKQVDISTVTNNQCPIYSVIDFARYWFSVDVMKEFSKLIGPRVRCILSCFLGIQDLTDSKFEMASKEFISCWRADLALAGYYLGLMYLEGCFFEKNKSAAFILLKQAAEKSNSEAMHLLANLDSAYWLKESVINEYKIDVLWYIEQSAIMGSSVEAYDFGLHYITIKHDKYIYFRRPHKIFCFFI